MRDGAFTTLDFDPASVTVKQMLIRAAVPEVEGLLACALPCKLGPIYFRPHAQVVRHVDGRFDARLMAHRATVC